MSSPTNSAHWYLDQFENAMLLQRDHERVGRYILSHIKEVTLPNDEKLLGEYEILASKLKFLPNSLHLFWMHLYYALLDGIYHVEYQSHPVTPADRVVISKLFKTFINDVPLDIYVLISALLES